MRFAVNGVDAFAATGGRKHVDGRPWMVFLHGAGFSHLTWLLQTRALAFDGWNVLAPDLPGHNLSKGEPIAGVAAQAEWVLQAMDAVGCETAVLCGHSMGGLIALETAKRAPERIKAIIFVASAATIPVNEELIATAETDEPQAFASMTAWSHGPQAHIHDNSWPGGSHLNFAVDTMALNRTGSLASDLVSCASYEGGLAAAGALSCPTLCVFARKDRMTPLKNGIKLAEALAENDLLVIENCGHTIPTEKPAELNAAIRQFLARHFADAKAV